MTRESDSRGLYNERARKERRYKMLSVGIDVILDLLFPVGDKNIISRIKLPDDIHAITVHYSQDRQSFLFLLESESFQHVCPGKNIPYIDEKYWYVTRNQVVLEDLKND